MRPRPERAPRAVVVGGAGAVWGLGLARFLAEAALWSPAYDSTLVVGGIAISCGLAVLGLRRRSTVASDSSAIIGHWSSAAPLALPVLYVTEVFAGPLAGGVLLIGGAALALLVTWRDRPGWLLPVLLGLATLGLTLRTLLPSVGEADTMEFQVVAAKLGVAHPTGYPLYILLVKLFTLLPLNNVAWRVNLASAVFATAAGLVLYGVVRNLTDRPLLSVLTALGFAFSRTFWSQAVIAEVYTLHNLLVAVILWLLLRPEGEGGAGQARRWQAALFVMGLSLTNHLTTALLIPAVVVALVWDRPRLRLREWLAGAGLFVLGLLVYLFIPLRWPALHDGRWMTLREFFTYVTGGQFHGALRLDGWQDPTRWRIVTRLVREPFGWVGIGLGVAGVVDLAVRRRRALALTGVTFLAFAVYGLSYYVADIAVFLLPAHLILGVWIGAGAASLARLLPPACPLSSDAWRPCLAALFALLPLSRIWGNFSAVDRSRDRGGYAWGRYALDQPLAEHSAILADTKKFAPLYYLQQVEGVRPDLDVVVLGTEALYQADLRRRLERGQTVYLARYLPHLEGFYLRSVGPLAEVRGEPPDGNRAFDGVAQELGERVQLVDVEMERDALGRDVAHLTLHWRARTSLSRDLVVRLRGVGADGRVAWTSEASRPVNGLYPTNAWAVGVPISDYHEVPIPPWLPPGAYRLEGGLFSPFGDEGLMGGEMTSWVPLGTLEVEAPSDPDPLPQRRLTGFGDGMWLTGFDSPGEIGTDSRLEIDLGWRGVERPQVVRLSWADADGGSRGDAEFPLSAGMVRSRHAITTPGDAGVYWLGVGLVDEPARCGWLGRPRDACPLTRVEVVAGREGLANFGDRVTLLEADVGRRVARANEVVPVTLRWRGLRSMGEDYTVFVQLIGPDGRLHGQVDSWPVQGSYPTSEWSPGEEVVDRYEVRLEPDAPPGDYRVEVGWYLLETMRRLQVLDAEGTAVADSFVVGTINVRE
ncbi:MAG: protein O-mannosyl-transferase family [Chloroflexota bacterium]